ncbi:MAG TPA: FkbM family methyltransferase [Thermoanaerobaculia bacterium]|nr:FkbM family methyltransferase [Thermoanaerobaculia bacterium]
MLQRRNGRLLCRCDGLLWQLDPRRHIHSEIIQKGVYERASVRWVRNNVAPQWVVFDVGANFGYYTLQLSRLVGPQGRVHAFEPSPRFRAELSEHLELNGCTNVVVEPVGLSDAPGRRELFRDRDTATFYQQPKPVSDSTPETVELTSLDLYAATRSLERLDFIKIDVDGEEERLLTGAQATLRRFRPLMLVEFAHFNLMLAGGGVESLAEKLRALDYVLCSEGSGEPFADRWELLVETLNCDHSVNVLCVPAERAPGGGDYGAPPR